MTEKDPHLVKTRIDDTKNADSDSIKVENSVSDSVEKETSTQKGTQTLKTEYGDTEHVKEGDNPARQPDARDQQGEYFDEGLNENNPQASAEMDDQPQSEEINEYNRYATIDNAQTRVLNTNDIKPAD